MGLCLSEQTALVAVAWADSKQASVCVIKSAQVSSLCCFKKDSGNQLAKKEEFFFSFSAFLFFFFVKNAVHLFSR